MLNQIGLLVSSQLQSVPVFHVDFIMGNNIAGGKVYPAPKVVSVPIDDSEPYDLVSHHPDVFKVSVLTRAQARKQAQEVELSDSLFSSVLSGEVWIVRQRRGGS